ncbi:MAG: hypothetical protein AAGD07_15645 [Planctomycetota bacterium]
MVIKPLGVVVWKPAERVLAWASLPVQALLWVLASVMLVLGGSGSPSVAYAGLSAENVVLVVNSQSQDSLTIANHYVALRGIPTRNVVCLDDVPTGVRCSLEDFRRRVLLPTINTINERRLAPHARVIAYSAGFPTGITIDSHTKQLKDPNAQKYQTPVAAINGLTFFYRWVMADSPDYLNWSSNLYARGTFDRNFVNPFRGEKAKAFDEAANAFDSSDFETAATKYEALADAYPGFAPVWVRAAISNARESRWDQAIEQLVKAIQAGWTHRRYVIANWTDVAEAAVQEVAQAMPGDRANKFLQIVGLLDDVPDTLQGPLAFGGDIEWTGSGYPVKSGSGGMPYLLSCCLAVTGQNASTVGQAIAHLKRSATADRTFPDATLGFAKTEDVRTKTRLPDVTNTLPTLLALGCEPNVFSSPVPTRTGSYVGLMLGAAGYRVENRPWKLVPGALAENLTSLGAHYGTGSQVKLNTLLHAGAAMSSGAVNEPYSIPMKFPTAMMHGYYARGVTAIEAYYLSTKSPYQLLMVGDPLTQPFARSPAAVGRIGDPIDTESERTVTLTLEGAQVTEQTSRIASIELYLQGVRVAVARPVANLRSKLPRELEGVLRYRATLVGLDATQPRISFARELVLGTQTPPMIRSLAKAGESVTVDVELPAGISADSQVELHHLGRVVGESSGASSRLIVPAKSLGQGPHRLHLEIVTGDRRVIGPGFEE